MFQFKEGDEVRFTVLDPTKENNTGYKIGIIDKIVYPTSFKTITETDRCEIVVEEDSDEKHYNVMFKEIDLLIRRGKYELGDFVILDFNEYGTISGMIDGVIETFDEVFYDVGIYTETGGYMCHVGTFSNNPTEVEYKILWDALRNE